MCQLLGNVYQTQSTASNNFQNADMAKKRQKCSSPNINKLNNTESSTSD